MVSYELEGSRASTYRCLVELLAGNVITPARLTASARSIVEQLDKRFDGDQVGGPK